MLRLHYPTSPSLYSETRSRKEWCLTLSHRKRNLNQTHSGLPKRLIHSVHYSWLPLVVSRWCHGQFSDSLASKSLHFILDSLGEWAFVPLSQKHLSILFEINQSLSLGRIPDISSALAHPLFIRRLRDLDHDLLDNSLICPRILRISTGNSSRLCHWGLVPCRSWQGCSPALSAGAYGINMAPGYKVQCPKKDCVDVHFWPKFCRWHILHLEQWLKLASAKYLQFSVSSRLFCGFRYICQWFWASIDVYAWVHQMTGGPDMSSILASAALTWNSRRTCDADEELLKSKFLGRWMNKWPLVTKCLFVKVSCCNWHHTKLWERSHLQALVQQNIEKNFLALFSGAFEPIERCHLLSSLIWWMTQLCMSQTREVIKSSSAMRFNDSLKSQPQGLVRIGKVSSASRRTFFQLQCWNEDSALIPQICNQEDSRPWRRPRSPLLRTSSCTRCRKKNASIQCSHSISIHFTSFRPHFLRIVYVICSYERKRKSAWEEAKFQAEQKCKFANFGTFANFARRKSYVWKK